MESTHPLRGPAEREVSTAASIGYAVPVPRRDAMVPIGVTRGWVMNSRLLTIVLAVALLPGAVGVGIQQEDQSGGWGTLSVGTTWQRIESGTTADLAGVSKLVSISRQTYGRNPTSDGFAASGGFCFDIETGGPRIYLVEQGELRWSFYDQQGTVSTLPMTGLALLRRAKDREKPPVVVAPGTDLRLEPGDLVIGHHGTSCSVSGADPAVTFVEVQGLSTSPDRAGFPEYGIEVQALDPSIGIATARPAAPQAIAVGRLTLPPGESVSLDASTMPVLFLMEQGVISVTTSVDGGIVLADGRSSPLPVGTVTSFNPGDSGYIPPGPEGTVTNAGDTPAVALSVSITSGAGEQVTPSR